MSSAATISAGRPARAASASSRAASGRGGSTPRRATSAAGPRLGPARGSAASAPKRSSEAAISSSGLRLMACGATGRAVRPTARSYEPRVCGLARRPSPWHHWPMDLEALKESLDERGEPPYRADQVWEWAARGERRLRGDDEPAARRSATTWPRRCRSPPCACEREARSADGTVKALFAHRGRAAAGGGADDLPRRPALDLRLLAVGLPAHLHVLRHGVDALRAQPDRGGDRRPGPALPAPRRRSTTASSWGWASR